MASNYYESGAEMRARVNAAHRRHDAIMALPEAKGREQQALSLSATDLAVEQVRDILAAAPAAAQPAVPVTYYAHPAQPSPAPNAAEDNRLADRMRAMLAKEGR